MVGAAWQFCAVRPLDLALLILRGWGSQERRNDGAPGFWKSGIAVQVAPQTGRPRFLPVFGAAPARMAAVRMRPWSPGAQSVIGAQLERNAFL